MQWTISGTNKLTWNITLFTIIILQSKFTYAIVQLPIRKFLSSRDPLSECGSSISAQSLDCLNQIIRISSEEKHWVKAVVMLSGLYWRLTEIMVYFIKSDFDVIATIELTNEGH